MSPVPSLSCSSPLLLHRSHTHTQFSQSLVTPSFLARYKFPYIPTNNEPEKAANSSARKNKEPGSNYIGPVSGSGSRDIVGPTRSWRSRTRNLGTAAAGRGGLCQRINRAFRLCIRGEEMCEKGRGEGGRTRPSTSRYGIRLSLTLAM